MYLILKYYIDSISIFFIVKSNNYNAPLGVSSHSIIITKLIKALIQPHSYKFDYTKLIVFFYMKYESG